MTTLTLVIAPMMRTAPLRQRRHQSPRSQPSQYPRTTLPPDPVHVVARADRSRKGYLRSVIPCGDEAAPGDLFLEGGWSPEEA